MTLEEAKAKTDELKQRLAAAHERIVEMEARAEARAADEEALMDRIAELGEILELQLRAEAQANRATRKRLLDGDRQRRIGVPGDLACGSLETPERILAEAARAGVRYGEGLVAYVKEHYGAERIGDVVELAKAARWD